MDTSKMSVTNVTSKKPLKVYVMPSSDLIIGYQGKGDDWLVEPMYVKTIAQIISVKDTLDRTVPKGVALDIFRNMGMKSLFVAGWVAWSIIEDTESRYYKEFEKCMNKTGASPNLVGIEGGNNGGR